MGCSSPEDMGCLIQVQKANPHGWMVWAKNTLQLGNGKSSISVSRANHANPLSISVFLLITSSAIMGDQEGQQSKYLASIGLEHCKNAALGNIMLKGVLHFSKNMQHRIKYVQVKPINKSRV